MGFITVMFTLCPWIKYRKKDNEQWIPSGTQTTSPTEPGLIGRGAWGATRPMASGRSLAGGLGNACLLTSACWLLRRFSQVVTVAQSLSLVQLFVTPWTAARQASLSLTDTQSPPKPMSIEPVMPSNHLILCRPLLLLPSIFPSIRVFSRVISSHQVAKVLDGASAAASVLPVNTQDWSPLGWTGWISFQSKGISSVVLGMSECPSSGGGGAKGPAKKWQHKSSKTKTNWTGPGFLNQQDPLLHLEKLPTFLYSSGCPQASPSPLLSHRVLNTAGQESGTRWASWCQRQRSWQVRACNRRCQVKQFTSLLCPFSCSSLCTTLLVVPVYENL